MWCICQSGLNEALGHHVDLFAVQCAGYLGLRGAYQHVEACFIYQGKSVPMLK